MQLQLIRNATLRLSYGGHLLLIDPYLAAKHSLPSYADRSPNPLVDLPMEPEAVIAGVEAVVVSHLHGDHFDAVAKAMLPKGLPVFCQPGDEERIAEAGFTDVRPPADAVTWQGIGIRRVAGQHGEGAVLEDMGPVSGFVFSAPGEPVFYDAGDTIWYEAVQQTVDTYQPDVIVTHSSGATWKGSPPIVMDAAMTIAVCRAAPDSTVVAIHLDSLDHGTVSRADLRAQAEAEGIGVDRLRVPADGERLEF